MAVENIVLQADDEPTLEAVKSANKALDTYERKAVGAAKAAGQAFEQEGQRTIRVIDRTRNSQERFLQSLEKRARFAGADAAERLRIEERLSLSRVSGDERAVQRVTQAYAKLRAAQNEQVSLGSRVRDAIRNPLEAASGAAESLIDRLGTLGIAVSAAGAALFLAGRAAFNLVAAQGAAAEQTVNLADRMGLAVGEAARLQAAADIAGVNVGSLDGAMRALSAALEEGGDASNRGQEALARLGVTAFNARGQIRPTGELLREIATRLSAIPEPAERVRLATAVLGRGAIELLPLINNFDELDETVRRLGVGMDENVIRKLAETDDEIGKLQVSWNELKQTMAGKITGVVEIARRMVDLTRTSPELVANAFIPGSGLLLSTSGARRPGAAAAGATTRAESEIERQFREADEDSVRRGAALIDRFRNELEGDRDLREQLTAVTKRRKEAEELVMQRGVGVDIVRLRIETVKDLRGEEQRLEAAIKGRSKAEQDAEKQQQLAARGLAEVRRIQGGAQRDIKTDKISGRDPEFYARQIQEQLSFERETLQMGIDTGERQLAVEMDFAERSRDARLRALESVDARTVQGKVAVENQRLAIEVETIDRLSLLHIAEIARRQEREVAYLEVLKQIRPEAEAQIQARIDAVILASAADAARVSSDRDAKISAARQDRELRVQEYARAEAQKTFDQYQRAFEGLFDAAFTRARSFWGAMRDLAFAIFLTPIKQGLSQMLAGALTGRGGGSGFSLGGLFAGGGSSVLGAGSVVGGPGGTGGFAGPVGGGGRFGIPGIGLTGIGGLRDFIGLGSSISTGAGSATTFGAASLSQKIGSVAKSDLAAAAGAGLAIAGLKRGGASGLAMTTGGGALIGFKFGGPMGAAIGAAAGFTAGFIRLFVKGATEKAKEKIRAVYGIRMDDKGVLSQIVETAKSAFGGNLDVAIRSPQIRDLIELYAMSTGQSVRGGFTRQMQPISLVQSGGSVSQIPSFQNGTAIPAISSSGNSGGVTIQNVTLQVNGESAADLLEGRVTSVVTPQYVQNQALSAGRSNYGRREAASQALFPSLVTS